MKMTRIEKQFVNRKKQSEGNIKKLDLALEYIDMRKIKTVLELGCGIGFVSQYLAETYNLTVYGTDYDKEQIQIAKKLQPKIDRLSFQIEDAANLSFEDSSVDLVLAQNVFHHIPNWEDAIKEIARVLCSGGYFVWLDLTFPRIVKNIFFPFVKNYGLYTIDDIETALEYHKFKKLFHERLSQGPLSQYHFVLQYI
jgi:ubiquinone/menaquinone biosynthesis C-methylase UbiE